MEKKKAKKKAKHSLHDLDVFEVSLVSRPSIGRKYLLTKSAEMPVEVEPEVTKRNKLIRRVKADSKPTVKSTIPATEIFLKAVTPRVKELMDTGMDEGSAQIKALGDAGYAGLYIAARGGETFSALLERALRQRQCLETK